MNLQEVDRLLTIIKNVDNRRIDDATVIVWREILGDLPFEDCVMAATKHFAESTDYLLPAHIRQGVLAIRNERAKKAHEVRELPSRFEPDPERAQRIQRGVQEIARRWSVPEKGSEDPVRDKALERARRERRAKPAMPARRGGDTGGKPLVLDKLTRGPEWADDDAREKAAVEALHAANRPCGRTMCPRCARRAFGGGHVDAA